ncbi:hypothetical protein KTQ42_13335|uniref:hypothetical protein n=1 Tax=Noviherbaspirillum sp. L7-7A TaxID=2850560 RepID=UPI001C2BB4FD|nr:hypothetical protein [Noviherbaspirillum sp. L7-7A]MBV0880288.1 hypothetical protein [Noviherbaspirillum sp. L7-7A]
MAMREKKMETVPQQEGQSAGRKKAPFYHWRRCVISLFRRETACILQIKPEFPGAIIDPTYSKNCL